MGISRLGLFCCFSYHQLLSPSTGPEFTASGNGLDRGDDASRCGLDAFLLLPLVQVDIIPSLAVVVPREQIPLKSLH